MNMIKLIFVGVIVVSAFGFVIYQIAHFFFSIQVSSSKLKKDLQKLKYKLVDIKQNLVGIDEETIRLLSFDKEEDLIQDKISIFKEGVFTSIYHEPMIAYIFKQYLARMDKAVLLVETQHNTYEYYISSESTRVYKNDELFGIIHRNGNIEHESTVLANIEIGDKRMLKVTRYNEPIAILNNPSFESTGLSRAFDMVDTKEPIGEELILVLSTLLAVQAD